MQDEENALKLQIEIYEAELYKHKQVIKEAIDLHDKLIVEYPELQGNGDFRITTRLMKFIYQDRKNQSR